MRIQDMPQGHQAEDHDFLKNPPKAHAAGQLLLHRRSHQPRHIIHRHKHHQGIQKTVKPSHGPAQVSAHSRKPALYHTHKLLHLKSLTFSAFLYGKSGPLPKAAALFPIPLSAHHSLTLHATPTHLIPFPGTSYHSPMFQNIFSTSTHFNPPPLTPRHPQPPSAYR